MVSTPKGASAASACSPACPVIRCVMPAPSVARVGSSYCGPHCLTKTTEAVLSCPGMRVPGATTDLVRADDDRPRLYWWKEAAIIAVFYAIYSSVRNLFGPARVGNGE